MTESSQSISTLIIGGGVIGSAIAERLSRSRESIMLVERGLRFGEETTSRNSGVIHGGLYYKPGSLKADTCIRGNQLLYDWCEAQGVTSAKTGKLVVAKADGECKRLAELYQNALKSGAIGCSMVNQKEIKKLEPALDGKEAIFSAETGIVDPIELTQSLLQKAEERGALAVPNCEVNGVTKRPSSYLIDTSLGEMEAETVINASGLESDRIAALAGVTHYKIYPCRGDYFRLSTQTQYRHLIYPVKAKEDPSLGAHLVLELDGNYKLGPDWEYVKSRSDYGPAEHKHAAFHQSAEELLGPIDPSALTYDSCGIRPKLQGPDDDEKDFVVAEDLPGWINLIGIDSPGLTASLALAEEVEKLLK